MKRLENHLVCLTIDNTDDRTTGYLLVIWDKDFLGLLDHWLRFQLVFRKLVLAWVEQLPPRHTGQNKVRGIRLEIDVHLNGFWINGGRSVAFFRVTSCKGGRKQSSGSTQCFTSF